MKELLPDPGQPEKTQVDNKVTPVVGESGQEYENVKVSDENLGTADHVVNS
jgi:hypothetical protein